MTEMQFRSDLVVKLLKHMGDDSDILQAMLVASDTDDPSEWEDPTSTKNRGRINALMRDRHGSPFEHAAIKLYVEAPIMVFREWHRHRIGFSYNEQSGRYSELPPMFYVPPRTRPLLKVDGTKQMDYVSEFADEGTYLDKVEGDKRIYTAAYEEYQRQLGIGIVKESARAILGVGIYSKQYVTLNPRSLMAFLSLRVRVDKPMYQEVPVPLGAERRYRRSIHTVDGPAAMFPSKPQWEINQCASQVEEFFAELFPVTYEAFVANGRVAP